MSLSIKDRAYNDARYSTIKSLYETLIRAGSYESLPDPDSEESQRFKKLYESLRIAVEELCSDPLLKEFEWVWLTITPETQHGFDTDPKSLATLIETWLTKCNHVDEYHFNIEQRADKVYEAGKGTHAHILIKRQGLKTYTEYNQWISRKWSPFHGIKFKFFNKNQTGSTYYKSEAFKEAKMEYLAGNKEGRHKQDLAMIDKAWRTSKDIQQIYSFVSNYK
jgi:hypothetical protein